MELFEILEKVCTQLPEVEAEKLKQEVNEIRRKALRTPQQSAAIDDLEGFIKDIKAAAAANLTENDEIDLFETLELVCGQLPENEAENLKQEVNKLRRAQEQASKKRSSEGT